jgi:hypothetical protein
MRAAVTSLAYASAAVTSLAYASAAVTSLAYASAAPVPSGASASQAPLRPCSQVNRALYGRKMENRKMKRTTKSKSKSDERKNKLTPVASKDPMASRNKKDWINRGKTIKHLIKELKTFENQELEVRISYNDAKPNLPISLVGKEGNQCVLMFCG